MKEHFQQRVDDTRQAYLDALDRLKAGTPTHPTLKGKQFKINASTIALESGKTRNPLYNTHKDILDLIQEVKCEQTDKEKSIQDDSEINLLKRKVTELEAKNKQLMNINATLLFNKNREAIC